MKKLCPLDKKECAKECVAYDREKNRCTMIEAMIELRIMARAYRRSKGIYRIKRLDKGGD